MRETGRLAEGEPRQFNTGLCIKSSLGSVGVIDRPDYLPFNTGFEGDMAVLSSIGIVSSDSDEDAYFGIMRRLGQRATHLSQQPEAVVLTEMQELEEQLKREAVQSINDLIELSMQYNIPVRTTPVNRRNIIIDENRYSPPDLVSRDNKATLVVIHTPQGAQPQFINLDLSELAIHEPEMVKKHIIAQLEQGITHNLFDHVKQEATKHQIELEEQFPSDLVRLGRIIAERNLPDSEAMRIKDRVINCLHDYSALLKLMDIFVSTNSLRSAVARSLFGAALSFMSYYDSRSPNELPQKMRGFSQCQARERLYGKQERQILNFIQSVYSNFELKQKYPNTQISEILPDTFLDDRALLCDPFAFLPSRLDSDIERIADEKDSAERFLRFIQEAQGAEDDIDLLSILEIEHPKVHQEFETFRRMLVKNPDRQEVFDYDYVVERIFTALPSINNLDSAREQVTKIVEFLLPPLGKESSDQISDSLNPESQIPELLVIIAKKRRGTATLNTQNGFQFEVALTEKYQKIIQQAQKETMKNNRRKRVWEYFCQEYNITPDQVQHLTNLVVEDSGELKQRNFGGLFIMLYLMKKGFFGEMDDELTSEFIKVVLPSRCQQPDINILKSERA